MGVDEIDAWHMTISSLHNRQCPTHAIPVVVVVLSCLLQLTVGTRGLCSTSFCTACANVRGAFFTRRNNRISSAAASVHRFMYGSTSRFSLSECPTILAFLGEEGVGVMVHAMPSCQPWYVLTVCQECRIRSAFLSPCRGDRRPFSLVTGTFTISPELQHI